MDNNNQKIPKVSIITVVFNGEKTIDQCMQSVIQQTYPNIEYIVIDGNSSDNTVKKIKENSKNVSYWCSEKDGGIYDAMNKGLARCTGDIIGLLNSDDWLELTAVEAIVACFQPTVDYVYGDVYLADQSGKISGLKRAEEPISAALPYRMPFAHQTFYMRSSVLKKCGFYSTSFRLSSDLEFINRVHSMGMQGKKLQPICANFRSGGASGGWETFIETREIAVKYGMSMSKSYFLFLCSVIKMNLDKILPLRLKNYVRKLKGSYFHS